MTPRSTNLLLGRQHEDIMQSLEHIHRLLHIILERTAHMSAVTDRLVASVAALTSAENSAITLLGQLSQLIRDNAEDPTALNKIADDIDANTTAIAAAVVANTPATPTPPAGGDTGSGGDTGGSTGGQV